MANEGLKIVDRVVKDELNGIIDERDNLWLTPVNSLK